MIFVGSVYKNDPEGFKILCAVMIFMTAVGVFFDKEEDDDDDYIDR
jgi:hypothetical protein